MAFFLCQVSRLCGEPLRDDTIASVCLNAEGKLDTIDGLEEKIETVIDIAPSITRFIVHPDDESDAKRITAGRLRIVRVTSTEEALKESFHRSLDDVLVGLGTTPRRRVAIERLFALTAAPKQSQQPWAAFARAAALVLREWMDKTEEENFKLQFAQSVAERHQYNETHAKLPWPIPSLIEFTPEERSAVLANVNQQSYDCGYPDEQSVVAAGDEWLPGNFRALTEGELRTAGSLGRLRAKQGDLAGANDLQIRLAGEWIHRRDGAGASWPLSEAYRLSGFLQDRIRFDAVEAERHKADEEVAAAIDKVPFVRLSRGRALLSLGDTADAQRLLEPVAADSKTFPHVRFSAARLLAKTRLEVPATSIEMRSAADASNGSDNRKLAQLFLALQRLDRVLEEHSATADDEDKAVACLQDLEPSLVGALVRLAASRGWPVGRTVADGFPY